MANEFKYMVYTRCMTFNHAPYIEDTLRGFSMQVTTFPVVFCIIDDASTDGEPDLLRKWTEDNLDFKSKVSRREMLDYGELMVAPFYSKENLLFVFLLLNKNRHKSKYPLPCLREWSSNAKYIALCEGDDYWTKPEKLQKQVDLMNLHPECFLVFHSVYEQYEDNPTRNHIRNYVEDREYSGLEWFKTRPSQTASFLYRKSMQESDYYKKVRSLKMPVGDIPLVLACAHEGKIWGCSEVMSVYRHHDGGYTSQKRNSETRIKLANNILKYHFFGDEYKDAVNYFYQMECANAFVALLKEYHLEWRFLKESLKVSFKGTLRAFYRVITHTYKY